jgi:hypothetical protein
LGGAGNNANAAAADANSAGFTKLSSSSLGGLATVDENAAPA